MATQADTTSATRTRPHAPFGLIVCGVDGSPSSIEAVRQAGALAGPNSTIDLVAVTTEWGSGLPGGALLDKEHAHEFLERAKAELGPSPARVIARTVPGRPVATQLLREAADADLLVVGRHGWSRLGGILIGSTASTILHKTKRPVLLAVRPPEGHVFPDRVMVAADGPDHPEDAIALATSIAELRGSDVTLFRVDWSRRAKRPEIAEAVAELRERTGHDAVEIMVGGTAHRLIPQYARDEHASLLITGSRGLKGVAAVRSVSERVAHESPCSVLVVHGEHGDA